MLLERNKDDQIVITVSSSVSKSGLTRLIDYLRYLEATGGSKARQADINKLARRLNAGWWKKNRKRFIK